MTECERIKQYNKTILHVPVADDFAIINAAKEYFGVDVHPNQLGKI